MKRVLFTILCFLTLIINCDAKVKLNKCVDGDTAKFIVNNKEITARFLAIDSPEITNNLDKYGKEASTFTCNKLKNAKNIVLEYDQNSNKYDKYNRHLVWVFVDGNLLQSEIVRNGYAQVKYLYDDYKYTNVLLKDQEYAQKNNLNIWSKGKNLEYILLLIAIILLVICIIKKEMTK